MKNGENKFVEMKNDIRYAIDNFFDVYLTMNPEETKPKYLPLMIMLIAEHLTRENYRKCVLYKGFPFLAEQSWEKSSKKGENNE